MIREKSGALRNCRSSLPLAWRPLPCLRYTLTDTAEEEQCTGGVCLAKSASLQSTKFGDLTSDRGNPPPNVRISNRRCSPEGLNQFACNSGNTHLEWSFAMLLPRTTLERVCGLLGTIESGVRARPTLCHEMVRASVSSPRRRLYLRARTN